ncbi:hypothetical protein [Segetibacter aerophilus]|uniref:Lipoprotein n=1 Tax=Segetibacter aerophilus TaxID=670293 RepID=A0A512B7J6_9BACT|nr:hypothetical protein [Segetibacter aerophilus]GEO07930.1 hypothetical protein SAE01_04260 [Segetibacter aerophilus]
MKKILSIILVAATLTACGGGESSESTTNVGEDSLKKAFDSVQQTGDTTALNRVMGDSTSASGTHGAGSGSRVGGGKSAGPQKQGGK